MFRTLSHSSSLLVAAAVLLSAPTVKAYRPFDMTDADVAEPGEFELELGPVQYVQEGKSRHLQTPRTVLNLGIVPRLEVTGGVASTVRLKRDDGPKYQIADSELFLKFLLRRGVVQEETGLSLALEAGPILPELHGETGVGASLNFIVSDQWDWLLLHLDSQAVLSRRELQFEWSNSLIGEGRFGAAVRPVTELHWEHAVSDRSNTFSVLAGAIWTVADNLDLDAAVVVGSIAKELGFEARLGLTWALQVWRGPGEPAKEPGEKTDGE